MMRWITRKRSVILLLAGAVALGGGCGIYRKRSANKAIQRVKEQSMEQARQAEAAKYAPERFTELQRQIDSANAKVTQGQYEEAIQEAQRAEGTAQLAIREAQSTKGKVEAKQREVETILGNAEEFLTRAEEAPPEVTPEQEMTAARDEIAVVRELLSQQMRGAQQKPEDYDPIVQSASAAYRASQYAYNLTLQEQATELEAGLAAQREEALGLEPAKYLPEETREMTGRWDEFDRLMREKAFEEALTLGGTLREEVPSFIAAVREKRAGVELEAARAARQRALDEGAGRFALEPMKACERAVTEAEEAFEAGEADRTYAAAMLAQEAAAEAVAELRNQADEIVARIGREIEAAEAEGAREHAPEILGEARKLYGDASLALEREAILQTIETGQKALERAGAAILQSKKVKAQAALERSQRSIDVAIEEGAAEYAPTELQKAQEQHALAEQQFKDGAYTEVHTLAAEAEKLSNRVLEVLENLTRETVAKAEAAQGRAVEAKAEELATEGLETSRQRLAEARTLLGSRRYRQAIELGKEAGKLAEEAETTAYRLRSEDMLARAEAEQQEAEKAGAAQYAGQGYNLALDQLRQGRAAYEAGEFAKSLGHAEHAVELATEARRKRLDTAIAAVGSASEALAAQYAAQTFNEALATLASAKQNMEARNYAEANQAADRAGSLAGQAETATWRARAEEKSDQVNQQVQRLVNNLGEAKCPEEVRQCRLLLADTNSLIQANRYREGYERGVEADEAAGVARSCLEAQAAAAYQELVQRSGRLTELATDPVGRAENAKLMPVLAEIKKALESQEYRMVFEKTAAATMLAGQAERIIKARNIELRIAALKGKAQALRETGQGAVLPQEFALLEAEVAGLNPAALGTDYEQAVRVLNDLEDRIELFAESVDKAVERKLASIKQTLTEARHAGALKYVRSTYEEAVDLYKQALSLPAQQDYHQLAASISAASEAAAGALSRTLIAIDETGYKDIIRNYMLELNSLLDRWPFAERRGSGKYGIDFVMAARSTKDADIYHELQRDLSDAEFRNRTKELYATVQQVQPPPSMKQLHEDVLAAFKTVSEAAEAFYRYGLYSLYGGEEREDFLWEAYAKLNALEFQIVTVQARLENLKPPRKKRFWGLFDVDRGLDPRNYIWIRYERS